MGELRLFASSAVIARAEQVMWQIREICGLPNMDFRKPDDRLAQDRVDILGEFTAACREDMQRYARRSVAAAAS